jgi:hypothetical protein
MWRWLLTVGLPIVEDFTAVKTFTRLIVMLQCLRTFVRLRYDEISRLALCVNACQTVVLSWPIDIGSFISLVNFWYSVCFFSLPGQKNLLPDLMATMQRGLRPFWVTLYSTGTMDEVVACIVCCDLPPAIHCVSSWFIV